MRLSDFVPEAKDISDSGWVLKEKAKGMRATSLTLPDGLSLPFVEHGDPSGKPLLLLHGYTDSWRSFETVLPHLPPWIRAVALTQRGHGDADKPASGYRPQDFAADLAAFMDELRIDAAVIAGHSMGSYIARRFALDHPHRTSGLVLAASSATVRGNPGVEELWTAVSGLEDPVSPVFAEEFQSSTLAQPVPRAFLDMVVQESLKVPARVWRSALEALRNTDHAAVLGRIKVPTLVLWGDRDEMFPRSDQDALVSAIPGARLVVYEGAGHALQWEEPERFAHDVAAFVKETLRHDETA